jgi:hypothetical protein
LLQGKCLSCYVTGRLSGISNFSYIRHPTGPTAAGSHLCSQLAGDAEVPSPPTCPAHWCMSPNSLCLHALSWHRSHFGCILTLPDQSAPRYISKSFLLTNPRLVCWPPRTIDKGGFQLAKDRRREKFSYNQLISWDPNYN